MFHLNISIVLGVNKEILSWKVKSSWPIQSTCITDSTGVPAVVLLQIKDSQVFCSAMEWINQFDLLSHIPYNSVADLTADVASAVGSQVSSVHAPEMSGEWQHTMVAAGTLLVGSAASCLGFEIATAAVVETDNQTLTKEVLRMAYQSASLRDVAEAAFSPKPRDQKMPIKDFLEQAHTLHPQQLAAELEAKGCRRIEDLAPLLQSDPDLWSKMRLHSGHEKKLLESIKFSIDGSWPSNALVPAPVDRKAKIHFPHKQKSRCSLLPTSTVVLADRRSQRATELRTGARIQSFDVQQSRMANTKVERCSQDSLTQVGLRMMQHVYNNSKEALIKVTLFDQMMKQYTLVVLEGQPLWALTQKGYSWVSAGKGKTQEMPSLKLGDKLVHYRKCLCVVVDVHPVQPSTIIDRLVHVSLQGIPNIFMDGFLAAAAVWSWTKSNGATDESDTFRCRFFSSEFLSWWDTIVQWGVPWLLILFQLLSSSLLFSLAQNSELPSDTHGHGKQHVWLFGSWQGQGIGVDWVSKKDGLIPGFDDDNWWSFHFWWSLSTENCCRAFPPFPNHIHFGQWCEGDPKLPRNSWVIYLYVYTYILALQWKKNLKRTYPRQRVVT